MTFFWLQRKGKTLKPRKNQLDSEGEALGHCIPPKGQAVSTDQYTLKWFCDFHEITKSKVY